jgi:hypothetical protein
MRGWMMILILLLFGPQLLRGQSLPLPEVLKVTALPADQLDSFMRKHFFYRQSSDSDSLSTSRYYTNIERSVQDPTWLRSLTVTDAVHNEYQARLVIYRTYNKSEYEAQLSWLLEHQFTNKGVFTFDASTHWLYSDGKVTVRLKVSEATLPENRRVKVYEVEAGQ